MKRLSIIIVAIAIQIAAFAQEVKTVSGKVCAANGEPLACVFVYEEGTSNGVMTDQIGQYSITITQEKSVLVASLLGFKDSRTPVGKNTVIDFRMEDDALLLSEAVVTGYGQVVTKDKLTASISKVSGDALTLGVHSNVVESLQGSVTGVRISSTTGQPGSTPNIVIRGGAALNGTGTPLYLVDGVQKEDLSDLNNNDIESVEILKDAAATALYGAKANAGVVLVTTKQGREGKSQISFNAKVGLNTLPSNHKFLKADDYLYYMRVAAYRSGNTAALNAAGPYGTGNVYTADGNASTDGVYSPMFLSEENKFLLNQGYKSMTDPVTGKTIIYNEFSSKDVSVRDVAITQDYNLSASGGNNKGKYYASFGYYDETGFPVVSAYKRFTFSGSGSYKITKWLESVTNINASKSGVSAVSDYISGGEKNFFGIMYSAPPTMRQYNLNGEPIICTTNWENGNWDAAKDFFYRRRDYYKLTIGQSLKFNFTEHLYLKLNAMGYFNFAEVEKSNKAYLSKPGAWNYDRGASFQYSRMISQTYNAIAGYENSWGKNNFNMILGFEFYDKTNFSSYTYGQGSEFDDFISLSYFDKTKAANISKINMTSTHTQERSMSAFTNIMYDYDGKYLVSFSGRYDGYSKLVNNKWGFFPGVSAAWNIHKENFMKNSAGWLSSLKLRAGYGQNGNVNILAGPYDLQGSYGKTGNYNGTYGILIDDLPYPDLQWEKTNSLDIAIEASFIDRIKVIIGGYNKLTYNLLATVPYPTSSGVGKQYTNNGSVRNRGLEMEIDATLYKNSDWTVRLAANATYMRSKVMSLPNNGNENNRQGGTQVYDPNTGDLIWVGGYQEGQEYGVAYAHYMTDIVRTDEDLVTYGWYKDITPAGGTIYGPAIWNTLSKEEQQKGQLLQKGDAIFYDVNGDQVIDQYDKVCMGNTIPRWVGGFTLSVAWKGLTLSAKFDFAGKYTAYDARRKWYMALSQGTFNTLIESKDTWSEQRPNATYPILMYADHLYRNNFRESNIFYQDNSYLCARDVALDWSLPEKWCKAIKMKGCNISVTGQNLFYLTKSTLYTPEYGAESNGGYGTPRTVIFGAKIIF